MRSSTTRKSTVRQPPHHPDEVDGGGGSPEEVQARAWLASHGRDPEVAGAGLPGDYQRDPDTGETLAPAPSAWLSQAGWQVVEDGREHRPIISYHEQGSEALWERLMLAVGKRFGATSGTALTQREMDTRIRLDRAMSRLPEARQQLLRMAFFEDLPNVAIAAEVGLNESTVRRNLAVAVQDLYVAVAETWALPYDPAEELLGIRPEGRPARDREGERRAAELVFVSTRIGDDDGEA
jgi:RNA polymerase sigma factor (sigma-70 family)